MTQTLVPPPVSYQIDNFEVPFLITHVTSERYFQGNFHIHNGFYEFYLFIKGEGFYYNDGIKHPLLPGDFILIAPGKLHRAYISNTVPYERIVLHLSEKTLMELSSPLTSLFHDCQKCCNHFYHFGTESLKNCISMSEPLITLSCSSPIHGQDLLQRSYLTILLLRTFEHIRQLSSEVFSPIPPVIQDVLDFITAHLTEEISVQSIADSLNISRSYLCHQFRDYYNTSLWNYILSKRLVLAQSLLLQGKTVTDVCYESGFRDYTHFIKTFSRTFGISPKKYSQNPNCQKTFLLPS